MLFYFVFSVNAFASETDEEIKKMIDGIESIKPSEYNDQMESVRIKILKYIDYKKKTCSGDYSPLLLQDAKQVAPLKAREKELCFSELKALYVTYINNMFKARKRYLIDIHEQTLKELDRAKIQAVSEINENFKKP